MTLSINQESPLTSDASFLIQGSEAALRSVYTPAECFTFTAAELHAPEICFLVARIDQKAVGCVALCTTKTYAEVKRLFVTKNARGTGCARALMTSLETLTRASGQTKIYLETGLKLSAAVALYRDIGYKTRGPFGDYQNHPTSLFMEKAL